MKKMSVLLIMIALLAITGTGYADIPTNLKVFDETTIGAEIDLPDLIKLTKNSSIGIRVGVFDLHEDWKDSSFAMIKFTSHWGVDLSK